jgi:hypothetical protein
MSRKSTILALAAIASLGAFALSSTDASAFGRGFGGMGGMHAGAAMHVGSGIHTPFRGNVAFNHFNHFNFAKVHPNWWQHNHWHFGWRWHPYWVAPVVAGGVATSYAAGGYSAPAATTNTCNCLTKSYTQEGAVVFKDVCTNEIAMNPPAGAGSAADAGSQQPQGYAQPQMPQQQQGYLQPPGQPAQYR